MFTLKNIVWSLLLVGVLLTGCSAADPQPTQFNATSKNITCEVYYRRSAGAQFNEAQRLQFSEGSGQQTLDFGDMALTAIFQDDQYEGRALSIAIANGNSGKEIARELYQFDPNNPTGNQFIGGHGFTGLVYVFHPDSGAEIQYFCSIQ